MNNNYMILSLKDILKVDNAEIYINKLLDEYKCNKNMDIESFFKKDSINFCKQNITETFLVFKESDSCSNFCRIFFNNLQNY